MNHAVRPFWQQTSGTNGERGQKRLAARLLVGDASFIVARVGRITRFFANDANHVQGSAMKRQPTTFSLSDRNGAHRHPVASAIAFRQAVLIRRLFRGAGVAAAWKI